jgi:hypothetical protein
VSQAFSVGLFEEIKNSNEITKRFRRDCCETKDLCVSRRLGSQHEARVANCPLYRFRRDRSQMFNQRRVIDTRLAHVSGEREDQ